MGRKSKNKANKNTVNQQQQQQQQQQPTTSTPVEIQPSVISSVKEAPSSTDNPAEPPEVAQAVVVVDATNTVAEDTSENTSSLEPGQSSEQKKKRKNRNRNKKKNLQNVPEEDIVSVVDNAKPIENAENAQNICEEGKKIEEENVEKLLNTSSKRNQRNNKKKNAQKANQKVESAENSINSEKDKIEEHLNDAADKVVVENKTSDNDEMSQGSTEEKLLLRQEKTKGAESQKTKIQKTTQIVEKKSDGDLKTSEDKSTVKNVDMPKTDDITNLAKITKALTPPRDPITIEISQPLVITTVKPSQEKDKEPTTEATLAQLIELVSNTEIPLSDVCPIASPTKTKTKIEEFQKPIADTGAALAELVNVVAGVDVPLKDVEIPILDDKIDKDNKMKKIKQADQSKQKGKMGTKAAAVQEPKIDKEDPVKLEEIKVEPKVEKVETKLEPSDHPSSEVAKKKEDKLPDSPKKDTKGQQKKQPPKNEPKHTNKGMKSEPKKNTTTETKPIDKDKEKKCELPEEKKNIESDHTVEETKKIDELATKPENSSKQELQAKVKCDLPQETLSGKSEEPKINPVEKEITKEGSSEAPKEVQDQVKQVSKEELKPEIKSESPKQPDIKTEESQKQKIEDLHLEIKEVQASASVSQMPEPEPSKEPAKPRNTTPTSMKKNKDEANLKEASEKGESKAKELPEKNPQEKMDAISFVPDKLIDILDTKMQTLNKSTGAIPKKMSKQKPEKVTGDMGAQTQISVLPTFEDKTKTSGQNKGTPPTGKVSPQPPKSSGSGSKKPQIPPKPEHLLKKTTPQIQQQQQTKQDPKKETIHQPKKSQLLSDDEDEFIEYKFTPRQVFIATICQVCKIALKEITPCLSCLMVSYCSAAHAQEDAVLHQQLCRALQEIARKRGGHVYNNAKILSHDDFRNLRVHTLNLCESLTQRSLQPFEKEILLFPRICCTPTCREWRTPLLTECQKCGQVSYCRDQPDHLSQDHQRWCPFFLLYQKLVLRQKNSGRIEPNLPSRIFLQRYELPNSMDEVFKELYKNNPAIKDDCTYATLTQLATAPLTAFYAINQIVQSDENKKTINVQESLTIHLVGAELQFEGDTLDKWEAFFLHLIPEVLELRVVFIGPELNAENLPLDILSRIRMCRTCRQSCRGVKFDFQCGKLYHDYVKQSAFTKPDLICFFNPGLYRATGFSGLDTWPETIKAATSLNAPIVVTSYTEIESPQDLAQLHRDSSRPLNLIQAPSVNPFSSQRPERNFISDEISPMIFKNYFVFIVS